MGNKLSTDSDWSEDGENQPNTQEADDTYNEDNKTSLPPLSKHEEYINEGTDICYSLLKSYEKDDLSSFEEILSQHSHTMTLDGDKLQYILCKIHSFQNTKRSKRNQSNYVSVLFKYLSGCSVRATVILLDCIEHEDVSILKLILKDPRTDPNIAVAKSAGYAPIHYAAVKRNTTCLERLLRHKKIMLNPVNGNGETALHIAARENNPEAAMLLIKAGIDWNMQDRAGRTGRDVVLRKFPELEYLLTRAKRLSLEDGSDDHLFYFIQQGDCATLLSTIEEHNITSLDKYLQYACQWGLQEAVPVLLKKEANPNTKSPVYSGTALELALRGGHDYIVEHLFKSTVHPPTITSKNILLKAVESACTCAKNEQDKHLKCLSHLLEYVTERFPEYINVKDEQGETLLHHAVYDGNVNVIHLLLKHGASLTEQNNSKRPPVADLNPETFEACLDQFITTYGQPSSKDYKIMFKYFISIGNISVNKSSDEDILEIYPLLNYMSQSPKLIHVLKHPILASYTYLNWKIVEKIFLINILLYSIFCLLLTTYILYTHEIKVAIKPTNESFYEKVLTEKMSFQNCWSCLLLRFLVVVFLLYLIVRELHQMMILFLSYLLDLHNWLDLTLIGVTLAVLFRIESVQEEISAAAILLSWTGFILLIGRHPKNSIQIEMLKCVLFNFFRFFMRYIALVGAFALSFYILFSNNSEIKGNLFSGIELSFIKTFVMLTGEFDAGSILLDTKPGISHVVFIVFVFVMATVLFNLLNGIAVGDTQAIRADAELYGIISQITVITYIEKMKLRNNSLIVKTVNRFFCSIFRHMAFGISKGDVDIFSGSSVIKKITVYPNRGNKVESSKGKLDRMDPKIVADAQNILNEKEEKKRKLDYQKKLTKTLKETKVIVKEHQEKMNRRLDETQRTINDLKDIITELRNNLMSISSIKECV